MPESKCPALAARCLTKTARESHAKPKFRFVQAPGADIVERTESTDDRRPAAALDARDTSLA